MNTADKLIFLDKPFTKEPITWAIRKTNPEFMKFSNDFLARVKADGRFDKIYRKWFLSSEWHQFKQMKTAVDIHVSLIGSAGNSASGILRQSAGLARDSSNSRRIQSD
jgi:hypothetical protein